MSYNSAPPPLLHLPSAGGACHARRIFGHAGIRLHRTCGHVMLKNSVATARDRKAQGLKPRIAPLVLSCLESFGLESFAKTQLLHCAWHPNRSSQPQRAFATIGTLASSYPLRSANETGDEDGGRGGPGTPGKARCWKEVRKTATVHRGSAHSLWPFRRDKTQWWSSYPDIRFGKQSLPYHTSWVCACVCPFTILSHMHITSCKI